MRKFYLDIFLKNSLCILSMGLQKTKRCCPKIFLNSKTFLLRSKTEKWAHIIRIILLINELIIHKLVIFFDHQTTRNYLLVNPGLFFENFLQRLRSWIFSCNHKLTRRSICILIHSFIPDLKLKCIEKAADGWIVHWSFYRPPGSRHPPGHRPCAVHAGRYGQQAGGTHPTGMHTCS